MTDIAVNAIIRANAKQLVQEVARTRAEFKGFGSDAQAQGKRAQAGLSQAGQGADLARRQIQLAKTALVGFLSIQAAARGLSDLRARADGYANLTAKIKLASNGQSQYVAAEAEVFAISQRTSTALNTTATLYSRIFNALKDQGGAQQEVLALTETINQSFAVSGATGAEAAAAIQQLSQAFASGTLRGDEFNSINEQAPRLMQALANSLGVTRGELRKMAEEGELSADKLRKGFSGAEAKKIADEYAQLPLTIERSFAQLDNAFTRYVGRASEASGAGSLIAVSIQGVAENFQTLVNIAGVAAALLAGRVAASLGVAAAAMLAKRAATVAALQAEVAEAAASQAQAAATVRAAQADVVRARTLQLTGASAGQLAAAEAALVVAQNAETAASARATIGQRALSVATGATAIATRGLSTALALVGGPIGIAIAGFAILAARMASASSEARQLKQDVTAAMDAAQRARDNDSIGQYQDSVGESLKVRQAEQERLRVLEESRRRATFRTLGGGLVGDASKGQFMSTSELDAEITATRSNIVGLTKDIGENNRRMLELSEANATGSRTTRQIGKDSADFSKELEKQAESSRLSTIELTKGYRARLVAEAVAKDGVKSEKDLSAARIALIDKTARSKAEEEAATAAKKQGAKSSRDAAGEAKKHAEELKKLTEAQRDFRNETAQLQASGRGELFGADERVRQLIEAAQRDGAASQAGDADVRARVAALTADAQRQVQALIEGGRIQLLQGTGQIVEAATAEATEKYQQTIDYMVATGNTAGANIFRNLFNVDIAKAQLAQLQQQVDQAFSNLQRQEQSLQTQVQTGSLTDYDARQKLIDLYRQHGATIDELLPKMEALARVTGDPQAIERVRQIRSELEQLNATTSLFQQQAGQTFTGAFSSALEGLITQSKTLREAFSGFFADMAAGFARMAAQALAQAAWSKVLKVFGIEGGESIGAGAEKLDQAAVKTSIAAIGIGIAANQMLLAATALAAAGGAGGGGDGGGGGGGGWGGLLAQGLGALLGGGYASGGYTGPGGKYQPAGFVHKHEYVHPQESVNYYGLDFMRAIHTRQLPRFSVSRVAAPTPRHSFAEGGFAAQAMAAGGASNDMRVYVSMNEDQHAQRIANHPALAKAIIAVVSENGQAIKASW